MLSLEDEIRLQGLIEISRSAAFRKGLMHTSWDTIFDVKFEGTEQEVHDRLVELLEEDERKDDA